MAQEAASLTAVRSPDRPKDATSELPVADLLGLDSISISPSSKKESLPKVAFAEAATAMIKGIKALTELSAENAAYQLRIVEAGGLLLLRRLLLGNDYDLWASTEADQPLASLSSGSEHVDSVASKSKANPKDKPATVKPPLTTQIRKKSARLLSILSLQPSAAEMIVGDEDLCLWLENCADGYTIGNGELKTRSYARTVLLNVSHIEPGTSFPVGKDSKAGFRQDASSPKFEDMVFLVNPESIYWKNLSFKYRHGQKSMPSRPTPQSSAGIGSSISTLNQTEQRLHEEVSQEQPVMDVVFVHGLCGGPFKTWRVSDDKMSTTDKTGLVETVDRDAGKEGTCWPREWLSHDLPNSRLLTLKYKV